MRKILVGLDGSAAGEAALRWAARLALGFDAEVVTLNALKVPWSELKEQSYERWAAERDVLLEASWIAPAEELGVDVRGVVVEGDAREILVPTAQAEGADLIVLGRTGHGTDPGLFHLGKLVEHTAHHTTCPLAVVPVGAPVPTDTMVLGVDGSPGSAAAVRWCRDVAGPLGAAVTAVAIEESSLGWELTHPGLGWGPPDPDELAQRIAPLEEAGVKVDLVVQEQLHPADALLGVASARRADALVIGARGRGGFTGLRVGGVAMKILHRASRPLVLVPPSEG